MKFNKHNCERSRNGRKRPSAGSLMRWAAACLGVFAFATTAAAVPYDLDKFKPVLDDSKLQAPASSPALIQQGDFDGASNQYFFLDPTGPYMAFTVSGDGMRSELRQESGDWQTSTTDRLSLDGRLKLTVPETASLNQFTFMQIHDTNAGLNKPLIRLTWQRDRGALEDRLWAVIRTPDDLGQPIALDNLASIYIDLGARPTGFFDASIVVHENQMSVEIDGQVKVDMDVSYWDGLDNYFKAGVYLQDPGEAAVLFDQLSYGVNVPEPASFVTLGLGGLVLLQRRRTHSSRATFVP